MQIKSIENSKILYFLLFLSCLNIYEKGSFLFLVLILFVFVFFRLKISVDRVNSVLCFLLVSVSVIVSFYFYDLNAVIKCLNYGGAYIIAITIFNHAKNKEVAIKRLMFSIFSGFATQIMLVYLFNLYKGQPSTRTLYAIWNDGLISVTLIALLSSVIIGYSFYAIACNKNKALKVYSIVALVIVFFMNIMTATRTPFILLILVWFLLFVFYTRNSNISTKKKFWMCVLCVIVFAVLCYVNDWFGIKTFLLKSALFERMGEEGIKTTRIDIAQEFIARMWQYPFGGSFARREIGKYAHNILLELYDLYGIVPFVVTFVFYIQGIKNIFYMAKKGIYRSINFLLIGLYLSTMIQMFLEPVIEGFPILFYVFLFIHGISNCYINFSKGNRYYENSRN